MDLAFSSINYDNIELTKLIGGIWEQTDIAKNKSGSSAMSWIANPFHFIIQSDIVFLLVDFCMGGVVIFAPTMWCICSAWSSYFSVFFMTTEGICQFRSTYIY